MDITQAPHAPQIAAGRGFWLVLALAVLIRLPGIDRPLVGNFATKNVVYAMIARNWAEGRASLWCPTLDCLVEGRRSLHMLEFPAAAYLAGLGWWTLGGSLAVWGRAISVAFSAASGALLMAWVGRRHGRSPALAAGWALAVAPVSIIYGQSFMLEPSVVFFLLAALENLDRWLLGGRPGWLAAAGLCLAVMLLTKIYMLAVLPVVVWYTWRGVHGSPDTRTFLLVAVTAALACVPAVAWYAHAYQAAAPGAPLAGHVYYSVRNSAEVHAFPHPLLGRPDFYGRLLGDLWGVVLTPLGLVLLAVGFLDRSWRRHWPWLAASVILPLALPRKFYELNYYWLPVLPPLCVMVGLGWNRTLDRMRQQKWSLPRTAMAVVICVSIVLALRYAVRPAFVTPPEDRAVVAAGQAIGRLAAPDQRVVAMHGSTIDLLYYCDRPGWAVDPAAPGLAETLARCRAEGARWVVITGRQVDALEGIPLVSPVPEASGDGFRIYRFL